MRTVSIFCLFLCAAFSLEAAPLKVPSERYAGYGDKRTHPGHYPFVSYLTFRNFCDRVIDDYAEWFDPDIVEPGDTIYLNLWYLEWFVQHVHDRIKHPYILITGDVGAWWPPPEFKKILYDPKLAAWFCRNMVFSYHPKLFQIPMGQDLALFDVGPKAHFPLLDAIGAQPLPKKHLLFMCHHPRRHGDRDRLVELFENEPYCSTCNRSGDVHFNNRISQKQFYEELASSQFALSPLGLETDCVRTWEALVLDCIPIVEHTFLDASYDRLPVVMVHDWKEVNPPFLEKKYQELKGRRLDEAYFEYWANLIRDVQLKVKKKEVSFSRLESTLFSSEDLEDLIFILNNEACQVRSLFYKGFLSSLRPLQLLDSDPFLLKLYLCDYWLDHDTLANLEGHLVSFGRKKTEVQIIADPDFIDALETSQNCCSVFLDLTYYRTSLFIDFGMCGVEYGNFRQSLKSDMNRLWKTLADHSVLIGNMVNNDYVKEVLEMFCRENDLTLQKRGSFWFLVKEPIYDWHAR